MTLIQDYQLGKQLFASSVGELFYGRTLRSARYDDAENAGRVLLHILPFELNNTVRDDNDLSVLLSDLCAKVEQANSFQVPVLKILDVGRTNTQRLYCVLECPDTWAAQPLSPVQEDDSLSSVHQTAQRINHSLAEHGMLADDIKPELFLVLPDGGLQLLGSVFSPQLLRLPYAPPETIANTSNVQSTKKPMVWVASLSIAALVLVSAFGAWYWINNIYPSTTNHLEEIATETPVPEPATAVISTEAETIIAVATDEAPQDIQPENEALVKPVMASENAESERLVPEVPVSKEAEVIQQPVETPFPSKELAVIPQVDEGLMPATPAQSGLMAEIAQDLEKNQPSHSVHRLRLLKRIDPTSPHVKTAAASIVTHYHNRLSAYKGQSQTVLAITRGIINNYQLDELRPKQELLETKLASE